VQTSDWDEVYRKVVALVESFPMVFLKSPAHIKIGAILDPSFGHNLGFRCPNGSCEPILDIYVPKTFEWYKELFNPMGLTPWNRSLKIRKSIGTLTPKVGVHLGVWRFNPHTLPYSQPPGSMKCDSRASLLAHTFISPCFGCKPKVKVATFTHCNHYSIWLHFNYWPS
jgi:hypothetical protein